MVKYLYKWKGDNKKMKKLWKSYLAIAPDFNAILLGIDLGFSLGLLLGIAIILMHNTGIIWKKCLTNL